MNYLVYDGTFGGFLTAVFDVYDLKLKDVQIRKETDEIPQLFSEQIHVGFDEVKVQRVRKKLVEFLGKQGFQKLWKATLSEFPEVEDVLLGVIRYTLEKKKNVLGDFGNIHVLQLQGILKKVGRERHRMTAFVRFELAKDGIYYATVEPDFDVLPLISNHFKNRYADQKWLIFDVKRHYGIYYDLNQVITVEIQSKNSENLPALVEIDWDETEKEFQVLWKKYFQATGIQSRKNTKLHLQYMPKRYWKYLTEKIP